MASPSAGMTKEEIKQRLAQMKAQYAQMQKKLEKSDKAARVKRHVSKKIADYKQKQATGGSPDCTVSKAVESLRDNPENTGSPVPSDNRGRLSTETRVSMTREKNGKRRSVSFALSSQSTPTSSRHDLVQETTVSQEQLGDSLVDQTPSSRVSPQHQAKKMEGVLKESRDVPSKKLFKSAKSERQKPVLASGDIVVEKSTDSNVDLGFSDHHDSKQSVSTGKIIKASMIQHRADDEAQSKSHLRENRMHKMDTLQMEEILSSPDAKTPPEDTQFDLFADSEPREESPGVTETVSEFPTDHSRVSDVKRVTAASSLQVVSSCGQHLMSSGHAGKDSFQDFSQCELKGQKQEVEESLIILDETQIDLFHTQIPERCTQGKTRRMLTTTGAKETIPVVKVANPINTSKNHPEAVEKCPTGMMPKPVKAGKKALHYKVNKEQEVCHSHQDPIYSVSDEEGTEDPDVIPSTFPEDLEPVTKNNSSQNSNSGHSDVSKAKHNQERDHSNIEDIINKDFQSVSKEKAIDETGDDSDEIIICTQRSEANQVDMAQISARVPAKGEPVDYEVSKVTLGNDETQQNTNQSQDPDFTNLHSREALICSPENTSSRVHESPEEKGKNGTHRRRRKNQRSIDNLSVDDISLKDFVVSQQNSQEGSHTWIDGLMYPAEYYVRKTRSMSKPSPNQYSAPLLGQKRSAGSSRGRKGPLPRNCQTTAMSEPVVSTKSLDEGQLKDGRDASHVEVSEKIDLNKDNTCAFVENSQGFTGRSHYETTKSAPKEPSSPRKMKVLRKPAAAKRRRGRKSSKKKLQGDSEQSVIETTNSQSLSQVVSQDELKEPQNYLAKSEDVSKHEGDQIEYNDGTNHFSNKDGHPSVAGDPHFEMNSLDLQEKPARDENESNTNSVMWEGNKHISITQMTNNPLESQFTQTQVPSNFALPQVFGTPGHVTQVPVGLSPHSPTSTAINPLGSPTIKLTASQHHGRTDPVPNLEHRRNSGQNQKYTEDQWMSEVYLADVVGELPDDDDSEHQNQEHLQELDGGHLSPHSQDLELNDHPNILSTSQCVPITESKASDIPVMNVTRLVDDLSQETTNNSRPQDILPGTSSYSISSLDADIKGNEHHTIERTATTYLLDHNEPIQDHIPSSTPAISSSLCSNVDQGSPLADAATGTPPEVAEMPQAQSQCTDSYRDGPEFDERSHGKEIAGGDLSVRECFQFRGCLEHKTEPFSEVQQILSSRLVTKGGSESLIAVVFPMEIFFWVTRTAGAENDFQALCSWRMNEGPEKISFVELQPGLTDAIEAVVAMGDEEKFHSVRCIRWDCKETRWEENTVLSSKHIPQTTHTSLCVLQERKAALAVYRKGAGSEVLVVGLGSGGSENQDFPVVSLPASKKRINSLTVVKGAVHMLLGVTDSEALLWQLPSQQLVQQFNLKDQRVNICIEAIAESGLLFMVAFNKLDNETKDHSVEPSCSLLVVNPMNGHSSKLLSYSSPCMQPGNQIKDASVFNKNTLAACLTSGHICVWDLHSSQLLMEACHEPEKGSTAALCQQDAKTLLLASDSCINIYERSF